MSDSDEPRGRARRTGAAVGTMLATTVLIMANVTFVSAVLAEVATTFAASQSQVQLVGDALPVMLAALLLPAGALLDRYGRRRGVICGLCLMAAALVGSAFAPTIEALITTRAVAGIGAALAFPGTLSTITNVTPPEGRARGVALWTGACMLGGVFGLLFAGTVVEIAGTDAMFLGMAVLTVVCAAAAMAWIPETRATDQPRPDLLAAALAVVGIGSLTYGIVETPVRGVESTVVVAALLVGVLASVGFCVRCLRAARPLLDLRIFRDRRVALGFASIYLLFMCSQAWFFLGFQYNSYVFGWGPLASAAGIAPAGLTIVPFAVLGAVVARRLGAARVVFGALIAIGLTSPVLGYAGLTQDYLVVASATLVWGVGIGLAQAPSTQMIIEALPAAQQGVASALNDLARELGAAFGIALIGAAFNAGYRHSVEAALGGAAQAGPVADSPAAGVSMAHTDPTVPLSAVRDGVAAGWLSALSAGGACVLVGCLALALLMRRSGASLPASPEDVDAGQTNRYTTVQTTV